MSLRLAAACGLLVACQREEPVSAPRPPPAAVANTAAPVASTASALDASARAAIPAPELAEPSGDPGTLWVPALFRVGAVARFRVTDSVDPHAPSGGRVDARGEVELVVCDVRWTPGDGGARAVASGSFVDRPGPEELASLLPAVRVAGTPSELVLLGEPPRVLRRAGAGRGRAGAVGCVEERDAGPYGPSKARFCFDELGLTLVRLENRAGPRLTVATRVGSPTLDRKRCGEAPAR